MFWTCSLSVQFIKFPSMDFLKSLLTPLNLASWGPFVKSRSYTKAHTLFASFWKIEPYITFEVLMGAASWIIRLLDIIWLECSSSSLSYFWRFVGGSWRGLELEFSEGWEEDLFLDWICVFMWLEILVSKLVLFIILLYIFPYNQNNIEWLY